MPSQIPPVVADPQRRLSLSPLDLSQTPTACRNAPLLDEQHCKYMIRNAAIKIYRHEKCTRFWAKNVSRSVSFYVSHVSWMPIFSCLKEFDKSNVIIDENHSASMEKINYNGSSTASTLNAALPDPRFFELQRV